MADVSATKVRSAGEILGATKKSRSVVQDIFVSYHPLLANEEESLGALFPQQQAAEFLSQLTDLTAILSAQDEYQVMISKLQGHIEQAEGVLNELMAQLFEKIRPIERSYRMVTLFYENANVPDGRVRSPAELYIFNADLKTTQTIRGTTMVAVEDFLHRRNDDFNFRKAICNLVAPGFLRGPIREHLEDIAYAHGMLLITDGDDEKSFKSLQQQFLTGGKYEFLKRPEDRAAADVVTVGYLMLREGYEFEKKEARVEKGDDLYCPPSIVLAGAIVRTDDLTGIGQGPIGMKFGQIKGTEGCRLHLLIGESSDLAMNRQVVPIIRDSNDHLCFYGCRSLADDPYGPYKFFTAYRILRIIERMSRHYLLEVAGERTDRNTVEERVEKPLRQMLLDAEKDGIISRFELFVDKTFAKLEDGVVDITLEVAPVGPAETFKLRIEPPKRKEPK